MMIFVVKSPKIFFGIKYQYRICSEIKLISPILAECFVVNDYLLYFP